MKKILFTIFAISLLLCTKVVAQQDAQFTQYMFNKLYFNPATAGVEHEYNELTVIHRSQWAGYDPTFSTDGKAPTTQIMSFSMPFPRKESAEYNNWGFGLNLQNDNAGNFNYLRAKLGIAYHLETKAGKLSFGLSSGIDNIKLDGSKLRFVDPLDDLNKPESQSDAKFDLDAGIYFNSAKYFIGVAATGLLGSEYDLLGDGSVKSAERALHGNIMAGYYLDVSANWQIQPSGILKYAEQDNLSYEASILGMYQDKFYIGFGYRDSDAASVLIGVNVMENQKLRIGYAFDLITDGENAKEATSHEIRITYRMPPIIKTVPSIIRTPRFKHY
jgi:type IX secretion system PorP/SprF family membrane protein